MNDLPENRLPQATDILALLSAPPVPNKPRLKFENQSKPLHQNNRQNKPQFQRQFAPKHNHQERRPVAPRNWSLWCETCDRDFGSIDQLNSHKSEHQVCGIDGCKFIGHPLVVTKHIQMQHSSGLYERIKQSESPEDIAKWREERKRNYPTRANIELKQKVKEEKQKRGEKLNDPKNRFASKEDRNLTRNRKKRSRKNKNNQESKQSGKKPEDIVKVKNEIVSNQGVVMFSGTLGMDGFLKESLVKLNPLSHLIGMYSSDDEEEEGEIIEEKLSENDEKLSKEMIISNMNPDGQTIEPKTSPPSTNTPNSTQTQDSSSKRKRKPPNQEQQENKKIPKKAVKSGLNLNANRRPPNTLLWKLLQKEVRHERNVLLQAVRFVVDNQFFDNKPVE